MRISDQCWSCQHLPSTRLLLMTATFGLFSLFQVSHAQTVSWCKQLGGPARVLAYELTSDAVGNVYTAGTFTGTADFDPGPSVFNLSSNTPVGEYGGDVFVSKLDANGDFLWAIKLQVPPSSTDLYANQAYSISLDGLGGVYLTGSFEGSLDFDPGPGTHILTSNGSRDMFVSKLDENGQLQWAASMGGPSSDFGYDGVADASGIYLIGAFSDTADLDPGPNYYPFASVGPGDGCMIKLDPSGNLIWASQIGGPEGDGLRSCALDGSGDLIVTGSFGGQADFDPTAATSYLTAAGSLDAIVGKYTPFGDLIWAKALGGTSPDFGKEITTDDQDNVLITGVFQDTSDMDPGPGVFELTSWGNYDAFVTKLDENGDFVWSAGMGANFVDSGEGIATDEQGNVYTIGYFFGQVDFDPSAGTVPVTTHGGADAFVLKLDQNGNLVWAIPFGSYQHDDGWGLDVDVNGDLVTTGRFKQTVDFDPGSDSLHLTGTGDFDVFVHKMGQCALEASVENAAPTLISNTLGAFYQWVDCDQDHAPIPGETGQSFTATESGNYAVVVTDPDNNCTVVSDCINIVVTGQTITGNNVTTSIYPVPTNGMLTIETRLAGNATAQIFDQKGALVLESSVEAGQVNISTLSTGTYTIHVYTEQGVYTQNVLRY